MISNAAGETIVGVLGEIYFRLSLYREGLETVDVQELVIGASFM